MNGSFPRNFLSKSITFIVYFLKGIPNVGSDEKLARFVFSSSHIRTSDKSVKPDAFMPPKNLKCSVTRHSFPLKLSENDLWEIGKSIAKCRNVTLYGRGDIKADEVCQNSLDVIPEQVFGNPNHANIVHWPNDKALQKNIAQKLSAAARYIPKP